MAMDVEESEAAVGSIDHSIEAQKQERADKIGLLKKINLVMKEVELIEKDGTNSHFGYKYTSAQAVKTPLRAAFVKHGLVFDMNIDHVNVVSEKGSKQDQMLTTITGEWAIYDIDTGYSIEGDCSGQGIDTGDKGIYKAITGAVKNKLIVLFSLPTGDDPEDDGAASKPAAQSHRYSQQEIDELDAMFNTTPDGSLALGSLKNGLTLRKSGETSKRPNTLYWSYEADGKREFHSWYEKNPEANPDLK